MATHSGILAWRIPWTEEPGRLQSLRSQRRTRLSDCAHIPEPSLENATPLIIGLSKPRIAFSAETR